MHASLRIPGVLLFCVTGVAAAALDAPWPQRVVLRESSPAAYYWKAKPVAENAQLLTLFCGSCGPASEIQRNLPLLAVLRDTLGDENDGNGRVTYVWLLSYSRPTIGQRLLSAIPFFYWHMGQGSSHVGKGVMKPFFNLSAPRHPVLTQVGRDVLQYTTFDPMIMPIRATSRAYRTNEINHERLHLEEVISYLRQAPSSDSPRGSSQECPLQNQAGPRWRQRDPAMQCRLIPDAHRGYMATENEQRTPRRRQRAACNERDCRLVAGRERRQSIGLALSTAHVARAPRLRTFLFHHRADPVERSHSQRGGADRQQGNTAEPQPRAGPGRLAPLSGG